MPEKKSNALDEMEMADEGIEMVSGGENNANAMDCFRCESCDATFEYEVGNVMSRLNAIENKRSHTKLRHGYPR